MKFKLPQTIYSLEQLDALIFELGEYLNWVRHISIQAKVGSRKTAVEQPELSQVLQDALISWADGKELALHDVEALIEDLKEYKEKAPSVHLTLAAIPSTALKNQLIEWFRTQISPMMMISFSANRTLVGGMVVRAGSHIYDYSWRKLLTEKRDKIPEIIRNVRG